MSVLGTQKKNIPIGFQTHVFSSVRVQLIKKNQNNLDLVIRCATITHVTPGLTRTISCNGMEGRYINIVIPGKKQYLTLCEVKVTGSPTTKPSQPGVYNLLYCEENCLKEIKTKL